MATKKKNNEEKDIKKLSNIEMPDINKKKINFSNAAIKGNLNIKSKKSDIDKFNKKTKPKKVSQTLSIKKQHDKKDLAKRIITIGLLVLLLGIIIYFICNSNRNTNDLIVINEETYISQVNEILSHKDEYLGRDIMFTGLYSSYDYNGKIYRMVYRTTPGTSGNNGIAAFDIEYNPEIELEENDWVTVCGTLKSYIDETDGEEYLTIVVKSLEKVEAQNKFVTK